MSGPRLVSSYRGEIRVEIALCFRLVAGKIERMHNRGWMLKGRKTGKKVHQIV